MAFCKQCGTDLNGAKFCSNCGAPADGELTAQQTYSSAPTDSRKQTLAELEKMRQYFGSKATQYTEYSKVAEKIEVLQSRKHLISLIAGILFIGLELCGLSGLWWIGAFFIALYVLKKLNTARKLKSAKQRFEELDEVLKSHYSAYGEETPLVFDYTYPVVLEKLYNIVYEGRAKNFEDLLNRYKDDCDKEEMKELQRQQRDLQMIDTVANTVSAVRRKK